MIAAQYGYLEEIDIVPAVPAPIAVLLGREPLPRIDPEPYDDCLCPLSSFADTSTRRLSGTDEHRDGHRYVPRLDANEPTSAQTSAILPTPRLTLERAPRLILKAWLIAAVRSRARVAPQLSARDAEPPGGRSNPSR